MMRCRRFCVRRFKPYTYISGFLISVIIFFTVSFIMTNSMSLESEYNNVFGHIRTNSSKAYGNSMELISLNKKDNELQAIRPVNFETHLTARGLDKHLHLIRPPKVRVREHPRLRLPKEIEEECLKLVRPGDNLGEDGFHQVDPDGRTYVFSAHFDDRTADVKVREVLIDLDEVFILYDWFNWNPRRWKLIDSFVRKIITTFVNCCPFESNQRSWNLLYQNSCNNLGSAILNQCLKIQILRRTAILLSKVEHSLPHQSRNVCYQYRCQSLIDSTCSDWKPLILISQWSASLWTW